MIKTYPIFLVGLCNRRCVVIGGGTEAERKVVGLLECDAWITIVGSRLTPTLRSIVNDRGVEWIGRNYRSGDLRGAFLVIVSGADPRLNARVRREAEAERVLINAMDDTEHCTFIAGSVVRRGPLTLAISTAGCAPALAVRLRERLERELGPEYAALLQLLSELREPLAERFPDFEQRRALWYELVDSDIVDHLRAGRPNAARNRAAELTSCFDAASSTRRPA